MTILSLHTAEGTIQDCGSPGSPFSLTNLQLIPDPPARGKPFDLIVAFNNNGTVINDGTITTTLTFDSIPFPSIQKPLCEYVVCPINPGPNYDNKSITWPDFITGNIESKITWTDTQNNQLACIQIDTKISGEKNLRKSHGITEFEIAIVADMLTYFKDPEAFDYDYGMAEFEWI
jgi:hypothetical protein